MKNLLNIIIIAFITLSLQANNTLDSHLRNDSISPSIYVTDLNLRTIKSDINNRTRNYFMTGSFTVVKTPSRNEGDIAKTVAISFRNTPIMAPEGKGNHYIQANAQAKRNDNNSINEFRIYIHQDGGSQGNIDKRNIKVNWKTGSIQVVNNLENVSIIYEEDSILIIGTMQKYGYTLGVSLAISKRKEIIGEILSSKK